MTYCSFAVIGGFAVNVSHMHNTLTEITLTPRGLVAFAERGRFFALTTKEIED